MGSPDWPRQSYQGYLTQKPSLPSTPYWTLTESFLGHPEWELVMGHFLTVRLAGLSVASSFFATSSNRSLFPNPELYIGSQTGLNAPLHTAICSCWLFSQPGPCLCQSRDTLQNPMSQQWQGLSSSGSHGTEENCLLQTGWKQREQQKEARPRNQAEPGNYSLHGRTGFAERCEVGGGWMLKRTWL